MNQQRNRQQNQYQRNNQYQDNKNKKQQALQDYVEVNVRIEKFWEKFENGRIKTDIVSWENGVIVMKAEVFRDINDEYPASNGFAYEKEGSSFINKTSALENGETSAIGRALANLGFEIKKSVSSKEEVYNAQLQQKEQQKREKLIQLVYTNYEKYFGTSEGFDKWLKDTEGQGHSLSKINDGLLVRLTDQHKKQKAVGDE